MVRVTKGKITNSLLINKCITEIQGKSILVPVSVGTRFKLARVQVFGNRLSSKA